MSLESTQAELEALERAPARPPKKKTKRGSKNAKPRDELGRFTKPAVMKGKSCSTS